LKKYQFAKEVNGNGYRLRETIPGRVGPQRAAPAISAVAARMFTPSSDDCGGGRGKMKTIDRPFAGPEKC
jgi:hypothetical protein